MITNPQVVEDSVIRALSAELEATSNESIYNKLFKEIITNIGKGDIIATLTQYVKFIELPETEIPAEMLPSLKRIKDYLRDELKL